MALSRLSLPAPPVKQARFLRYKPLDRAGIPPIWKPLLRYRVVGMSGPSRLWLQVRCRACGYERLARETFLYRGYPRRCPACHASRASATL